MENIYQKAFRNARLYKNISLRNFAPMLLVNKSHISKIENGLQKPSIDLIKKLEKVTGLSFWALVAGDFDNQKQYVKLSDLGIHNSPKKIDEMSAKDRSYLQSKFEVEISEIAEQIAKAKSRLTKQIEKSSLIVRELSALESDIQKTKINLNFLISNNAPAQMIADQQVILNKSETDLADKKNKGGFISNREMALEELMIEELEMKIKIRADKIEAIKAVV